MSVGTRDAIPGRIFALGLGAVVAGCALVSPPEKETSTAWLSKMPAEIPNREPTAVTLLVLKPESKPAYDTTRMAYSLGPSELDYFRHHEWGSTPSEMLQALLVTTLESTGSLQAVMTPPYTGRYRYSLRTEIVELVQDFAAEPAALRLVLGVRVSDDTAGRVVAAKEIAVREPMSQRSPSAGVVAANDATAKALREIADFVLEKIE